MAQNLLKEWGDGKAELQRAGADRQQVALKARADTAYRCEWEPAEQAALDAALAQWPAPRHSALERYVRAAAALPRKGVRDVALRCAWLRERGAQRKRKADEAASAAAPGGSASGAGGKKAARRDRGQSVFAVQAKAPAAGAGAAGACGVVGGVALGMGIGVPRIPPMAGLGPAPGLAMGAPPGHLAPGAQGGPGGAQMRGVPAGQLGGPAVGGAPGALPGGMYLPGGGLHPSMVAGAYFGAPAAANGGPPGAAAGAGDDQLPNHGAATTGGVGGPVADLLEQNYAIFQEYKANMAIYKVAENTQLLMRIHANIQKINHQMQHMEGVMQYMPPLPVEVNEHLMEVVLARSSASGMYAGGAMGPPPPLPGVAGSVAGRGHYNVTQLPRTYCAGILKSQRCETHGKRGQQQGGMDRAPSFSFPLPLLLPPPENHSGWPHSKAEEEGLWKTPNDLICPITHEVFRDPVINAAGQVYERAAIERHLGPAKGSAVDPVSRQPLPNRELTPVFILRSRAMEFRESVARRNVERACAPGCQDPVRHVRRAVELAGELAVPGLSRECAAYVASHPSNAYDGPALRVFARGLAAAGQRDRAAAVYCGLLQSAADRAAQKAVLLKYVQLQCRQLGNQQAAIAAQLAELRQRQAAAGAGPRREPSGSSPSPGARQLGRPAWVGRRVVVGAAAAAALVGGSHPLARLARLLPLIFLMQDMGLD
ncbi:hypothetical protein WJX81_005475 [Elliptochloris bilobata]|uniref:U-box domain-containing protein n=1 Tax=Elliptochloris bilobata TaxID=381761 RepID=A0AAW1R210_9CHLO